MDPDYMVRAPCKPLLHANAQRRTEVLLMLHGPLFVQRRYSVAKVDAAELYERGQPKEGGINDLRMGTTDRAERCITDGASAADSPGYFGHIELAKPMYHVGFIRTVLRVLRCVSFHNSKLLLDRVRFCAAPLQALLGRRNTHGIPVTFCRTTQSSSRQCALATQSSVCVRSCTIARAKGSARTPMHRSPSTG